MATTAGTLITVIRDQIPDPVYDGSGNPQPASDGQLVRAQTLYRWLNDGVIRLAELTGWRLVDWTAIATVANQATYAVDQKWITALECWHNGLQLWLAPEVYSVWPQPPASRQAVQYSPHQLNAQLSLRLFPMPSQTDPSTSLGSAAGSTDTTLTVGSTSGFLAAGYALVDSELVAYGALTATSLLAVQRGQGGTTAASHAQGATVQHCSVWVKGPRLPTPIAQATDPVDVPVAFQPALQNYVLARVALMRQQLDRYQVLNKEFEAQATVLANDPRWREDAQGTALLPTGMPLRGGLNYTQGPWGVVVP